MSTSSPLPPLVDVSDFAFQQSPPRLSSPHSNDIDIDVDGKSHVLSSPPAPALSPPHDYNFSSTVYDESSAPPTDHEDAYATTDDDNDVARHRRLQSGGAETSSSRSSISSLPVSVAPLPEKIPVTTPTRSPAPLGGLGHHTRSGSGLRYLSGRTGGVQDRDREITPFRHPSSVRAMQMRDEPDDELDLTPHHHRRRGSRMSLRSLTNSTTTSPTKRNSRSAQSSPQKSSGSKLKKEFPLVLLHCSLLPPTLGLQGMKVGHEESWWMREVLPGEYLTRWKVLEEKVWGNAEVRNRGVLIPHPRGEYELLEERLLESLELERPRVREGHFLGKVENGDEVSEEKASGVQGERECCPDCGRKVSTGVEAERKWEIKVYAANGLMRAGAWGAAWGEMEKVDVEVGVWMPENVRREVEARLHDMGYPGAEADETVHGGDNMEESEEERRRREIYGNTPMDTQDRVDGLFDDDEQLHHETAGHREETPNEQQQRHPPAAQHPPPPTSEMDFQSLLFNYLRVLVQDKRNVFIAFLSLLVLFYAMSTPISSDLNTALSSSQIHTPQVVGVTTTIMASPTTQVISVTTTITATPSLAASSPQACLSSTSSACREAAHSISTPSSSSNVPIECISTSSTPVTIASSETTSATSSEPSDTTSVTLSESSETTSVTSSGPPETSTMLHQEAEPETPPIVEQILDAVLGDEVPAAIAE